MKNYILVVDDSPTVRAAAQFALDEAGFDVKTADDGEDGFEKLKMIQKEGNKTAMIISDVNMPNMDGITFTKEVKKTVFKDIPILILTTESQVSKKEEGKAAGAVGWLIKPFLPEQLINVVKKFAESPKKTKAPQSKLEVKEHINKLLQVFCAESLERIPEIEENLSKLKEKSDDEELIESVFTEIHNIKGWSLFAGCIDIPGFSHVVENVLKKVRDKEVEVSSDLISIFFSSVKAIRRMVRAMMKGEKDTANERDMKDIKDYLQGYL
jgi:two-component system chemotaxis response regulator CheY